MVISPLFWSQVFGMGRCIACGLQCLLTNNSDSRITLPTLTLHVRWVAARPKPGSRNISGVISAHNVERNGTTRCPSPSVWTSLGLEQKKNTLTFQFSTEIESWDKISSPGSQNHQIPWILFSAASGWKPVSPDAIYFPRILGWVHVQMSKSCKNPTKNISCYFPVPGSLFYTAPSTGEFCILSTHE